METHTLEPWCFLECWQHFQSFSKAPCLQQFWQKGSSFPSIPHISARTLQVMQGVLSPECHRWWFRGISEWSLIALGHSRGDLRRRKRGRRGKSRRGGGGKQQVVEEGSKRRWDAALVELGGTSLTHLRLPSPEGMQAFPVRSRQGPALWFKCLQAHSLSSFSNAHIWAALPKRPMRLQKIIYSSK